MGITERKHQFIEKFMQIDDENRIKQFEELLNQEVVAYTVQGKPLSREEYKKEVLLAEQSGKYISIGELEKQIESW